MVLFTDTNKARLDGKLVAITGCNTGIGKETALELSRRGARLIMLCRNMDTAEEAKEEIVKDTNGVVETMKLDLSSLKSVRECADRILEKEDKLDMLVNNAGVMMTPAGSRTEDGFDAQFGTNHLGHFLLTELLQPLIKKAAVEGYRPRIIVVSSLAHEFASMHWEDLNWEKTSYNKVEAYGQSKLANVLHGAELARRLEGDNISVYIVHPGAVNTDLGRHMSQTWWGKIIMPLAKPFTKTPKQGAQTTLYCCLEESISDKSGKYYSDCMEKLPHRRARSEEDQKRLWDVSEKLVGLKPNQD